MNYFNKIRFPIIAVTVIFLLTTSTYSKRSEQDEATLLEEGPGNESTIILGPYDTIEDYYRMVKEEKEAREAQRNIYVSDTGEKEEKRQLALIKEIEKNAATDFNLIYQKKFYDDYGDRMYEAYHKKFWDVYRLRVLKKKLEEGKEADMLEKYFPKNRPGKAILSGPSGVSE